MITMKPASALEIGDTFSTDGYVVRSVNKLWDGRISVSLWLDASGGITKSARLAPDFECPIWTPDEREIVNIGWDGRSQPIYCYRDELHLPDTARTRVPPKR